MKNKKLIILTILAGTTLGLTQQATSVDANTINSNVVAAIGVIRIRYVDSRGDQLTSDDIVYGPSNTSAYPAILSKVNAVKRKLASLGWDYYAGNCRMNFSDTDQILTIYFKSTVRTSSIRIRYVDSHGNPLTSDDIVCGTPNTSAYPAILSKVNAVKRKLASLGWDYYAGNCRMNFSDTDQILTIYFK
ncbi:hypothetical protein [Enterococcus lactis]|uniref:hypothetical protein n=1 Tax=Enterococcus lactis TaxID=357441 RepID=UPI0040429B6B